MITITKPLDLPDTYPLSRIGKLEELLFFDIETTGFSGDYSNLYLIGCTYFKQGHWHLIQWFADTLDSEVELLHSFFAFMSQYKILVHFNGDGFDIPYLLKRCAYFQLFYDFSQITSFDIYKKIKPYRKFLQLDSLRQKAIECFLGITRTDCYSGGQLIEVYHDYLMTKDAFLYDLLILHNEDDLKGMPVILPILNYSDFLEHSFSLKGHEVIEEIDFFGTVHSLFVLTWESKYEIPVPIEIQKPPVACSIHEHQMRITIDLYQGTLKHFYPNYKDYVYLIYEDTAVHKSVGAFVDKDVRQKATAKTCYTKKEGCFLPQFSPIWSPVMKENPRDKISYSLLSDVSFQDLDCQRVYCKQLLQHLGVPTSTL